jgi:hypothetical protein
VNEPLRVTLTTHGGLAAGVARAQAARVVDTRRLAAADAARLRRLLRAARAPGDALPDGPLPGNRPGDVVRYTVTVEPAEPGEVVVLAATDLTMSDAFADLVDWIEEHAVDG